MNSCIAQLTCCALMPQLLKSLSAQLLAYRDLRCAITLSQQVTGKPCLYFQGKALEDHFKLGQLQPASWLHGRKGSSTSSSPSACRTQQAPAEHTPPQLGKVGPHGGGQEAGTQIHLLVQSAEKMALYSVDNLLHASSSLASAELSLPPMYQQVFGAGLGVRTPWGDFQARPVC